MLRRWEVREDKVHPSDLLPLEFSLGASEIPALVPSMQCKKVSDMTLSCAQSDREIETVRDGGGVDRGERDRGGERDRERYR